MIRNAELTLKNIVEGICVSSDMKNSFAFSPEEKLNC